MFRAEHISKIYSNGIVETRAINDISLSIGNEVVSIIGPSGSGKTTLLNLLSTIDTVSEGKIFYEETDLASLNEKRRADFRLNNFGFVFQKFELIPSLNIHDNIVLPAVFAKKKIDKEFMEKVLAILDLKSQLKKMPHELSGGQQQRVAIARALIGKPEVIFADEPTGSLDKKNGIHVIQLLVECVREFSNTLIYVTHNEELAKMADRIIKIEDGRIINE